ncbi:hypothetical protein EJD97_006828 [Solanum chilense]|uniref:NAD(P)-binding domain-containing protein n=1 Tax=Solanum chilense TaxID=4083 RepID=A0A6N2AIL5_SOLCI|nr:hypothetical protein EJD97_006828 [Solanum chilense]
MAPASNFDSVSNTVCVMDASTRLGSSLVKRLLTNGYTVHAAIQNIHNGGHGEFLDACDMKRLKNFHLDPFDYHSIIDALKGCSGLFYSFEPPKDQSCTYDIVSIQVIVIVSEDDYYLSDNMRN